MGRLYAHIMHLMLMRQIKQTESINSGILNICHIHDCHYLLFEHRMGKQQHIEGKYYYGKSVE